MSRIMIGALHGIQYLERLERCRSTWVPDALRMGMDVVFLQGLPELKETTRNGDMLWLPCPDAYPTLPQRTRLWCAWACAQPGWDYLFKCDDDSYVAAARLAAYDLADRDYVGGEWRTGVGYGSGGAGYFLSRKAAKIVSLKMTQETGSEDLLVGQVLREAGVPFSIEPRLIAYGSEAVRPRAGNNLLTVHGISGDLFEQTHRELTGAP